MKRIGVIATALLVSLFVCISCENFDEVNVNPNRAEEVSSNYLLSYVLTKTATNYYQLTVPGSIISGTMQYIQVGTNFRADEVNYYGWKPASWNGYYDILRNNQLIYDNSLEDNNHFFRAISLTMRAFVFGLLTDLYGDIPFTSALQAEKGIYFPAYDEQRVVYAGVLTDLREADNLLASLGDGDIVNPTSDLIYQGNPAKWQKFVNSLRVRYAWRLSLKASEMAGLGVDIAEEMRSAVPKAFAGNSDNANIEFLGLTAENSAEGGSLNSANPPYGYKPAQPLVSLLLQTNDPRLHRWVSPVLQKWDSHVGTIRDSTVTNIYGESFSVQFRPAPQNYTVDTSLYVGLPVGLANTVAMNYNKGNDQEVYHSERSPYISMLHPRYRENTDALLRMELMTYDEVAFILAEAALAGGSGVEGSAAQYYRSGIAASMERWGVSAAPSFNFEKFYSQPSIDLNAAADPHKRIMEQKWVAAWLRVDSWFDWRRTGFPDLKTGPVAQYGPRLPIRFMYPTPNLDPNYVVNYNEAVGRLEATDYVPEGQTKDHPYAKMWLLQETSKPW